MNARALITGATGTVGPAVVQALVAQGWQVTTFSRHDVAEGLFPNGVRHLQGDITDPIAASHAVQGQDVVFHLAALLHIENPDPALIDTYQQVNVLGTQVIVNAARDAGVKRFIYFSTVKVYGVQQYPPVDETMPPNPKTLYAQTKLDGEQVALGATGIESVVLRLSAVYGSRLEGSWRRLGKAIARGIFIPVGNLQNRRSLTYVTDVALAALCVAEHPQAAGNIYNVVGDEAVTMQEILTAMYAAHGRRVPPLRIPAGVVRLGLHAAKSGLGLVGRRLPINPESLNQLIDDETYSGQALRQLGYVSAISLESGWREALTSL